MSISVAVGIAVSMAIGMSIDLLDLLAAEVTELGVHRSIARRSLDEAMLVLPGNALVVRLVDQALAEPGTLHLGAGVVPVGGVLAEVGLIAQETADPAADDDGAPVSDELAARHPARGHGLHVSAIDDLNSQYGSPEGGRNSRSYLQQDTG